MGVGRAAAARGAALADAATLACLVCADAHSVWLARPCRTYATLLNATDISREEREAVLAGAELDGRNRSTADVYCKQRAGWGACSGRGHARGRARVPGSRSIFNESVQRMLRPCLCVPRLPAPGADTVAEVADAPGTWMYTYNLYYS